MTCKPTACFVSPRTLGALSALLIAAFAGVVGAHFTGSALAGLLTALGAGLIFALIHALMCITFEADQIISGTAINLLALGGTGFLMVEIFGSGGTSPRVDGFGTFAVPLLSLKSPPRAAKMSGVALRMVDWRMEAKAPRKSSI